MGGDVADRKTGTRVDLSALEQSDIIVKIELEQLIATLKKDIWYLKQEWASYDNRKICSLFAYWNTFVFDMGVLYIAALWQ